MFLHSKRIYLRETVVEGFLEIENGKICGISDQCGFDYTDYGNMMIIPGFIDVHVHGWGTGSFMSEKSSESLYEMKKYMPYEGVTSFLATTGADPIEDIITSIKSAEHVYKDQKFGSECIGIHLEGPFINKEFKGMQKEECCIEPNIETMQLLYETQSDKTMIKLMTIAPELPNSKEVISFCHDHGIQCSIGHSAATFECIKELKKYGLGGVTHMFSGMKGMHHRELGVAGSAMYFEDLMCEFAKQSGITVRHEAFDLIFRLKGADRVYLCTDCAGFAKVKEEHYHYVRKQTFVPFNGNLKIVNDDGSELLINTLDYKEVRNIELSFIKSVQNVMENTKMSIHDMIKLTSYNAAKYIHVEDKKGSIEVGKDADLVILDENLNLVTTYCKGVEFNAKSIQ